jgi:hypothetical protein
MRRLPLPQVGRFGDVAGALSLCRLEVQPARESGFFVACAMPSARRRSEA